jgi:hypothetical protein
MGEADWVGVIGFLNLGYLLSGLVAWRIPITSQATEPDQAR